MGTNACRYLFDCPEIFDCPQIINELGVERPGRPATPNGVPDFLLMTPNSLATEIVQL